MWMVLKYYNYNKFIVIEKWNNIVINIYGCDYYYVF